MAEQQSPGRILPIRMSANTAQTTFGTSVVNGVQCVTFSTGTTPLPAFNGLTANERIWINFRAEENFELQVTLGAITTKIDLYRLNGQLISSTSAVTTIQSLGTIQKNVSYYLGITSTVLVAAASLLGTMTIRQTPDLLSFVDSWKVDTVIPGLTFGFDSNGAHIATFNNVDVTNGVKIDLVNYYNTLVSGTYQQFYTGDFVTIFGGSSSTLVSFNSGLNLLWAFTPSYTGKLNGTIRFNFTGLGIASFIPMTFSAFLGERISMPTTYTSTRATPQQKLIRTKSAVIEIKDTNPEKEMQEKILEELVNNITEEKNEENVFIL